MYGYIYKIYLFINQLNKGITVRRTIGTAFYASEIDPDRRFLKISKRSSSCQASPIDAEACFPVIRARFNVRTILVFSMYI